MGQCRFIIKNLALTATFQTAAGHVAPVNETGWLALSDPSPANRARLPSIYYYSAGLYRYRFRMDLGGLVNMDTFALINTTIGVNARVTVWGYAEDPDVGSPPVIYSLQASGLVDRTRSRNQVVMTSSGKTAVRYLAIFIDASDAFLEIGAVVVGSSWQPTYNFDMEYQLGRMDMGTREYNQTTGAGFNFTGARPRLWTVTLGALSVDEVESYVDDIDRLCGATGDILFIPEHTDTFDKMSLRSVYGVCRLSGEGLAGQFFPNLYRRPMRIQESL